MSIALARIRRGRNGSDIILVNPEQIVSIYTDRVRRTAGRTAGPNSGEVLETTHIVVTSGGSIATSMTIAEVLAAIRKAEDE